MGTPRNAGATGYNTVQLNGWSETVNSVSITTLLTDGSGDILLATGTTVPTNSSTGFAKGCLFIDTDVGTGTTGLYCNKGTNTACAFTAVTQA
jgi:hypothetical protein